MSARRMVATAMCGLSVLACTDCGPSTGDAVVKEPPVAVVPPPQTGPQTTPPPPLAAPGPTATASAANLPPPANPSAPPEIVHRPKPAIPKVDVTPFVKMGCTLQGDTLDCSKSTPIKAFQCSGDTLRLDDALGALSPKAAIAECNAMPQRLSVGSSNPPPGAGSPPAPIGILRLGCMLPVYRRYLVSMNGKLTLVRSPQELAALFAPVETPEEALGFAVALSKAEPRFTLDIPPGARTAARIETSYAEPDAGGFKVHLFEYQVCGCGPHGHLAVDFWVGKDGSVKRTGSQEAYADPKMDHMCID